MTNVTVYTIPDCPWCSKLKEFFRREGIEYQEINVLDNYEQAKRMIELTGQRSVPVTVVDKQVLVGYAPQKIKDLLSADEHWQGQVGK